MVDKSFDRRNKDWPECDLAPRFASDSHRCRHKAYGQTFCDPSIAESTFNFRRYLPAYEGITSDELLMAEPIREGELRKYNRPFAKWMLTNKVDRWLDEWPECGGPRLNNRGHLRMHEIYGQAPCIASIIEYCGLVDEMAAHTSIDDYGEFGQSIDFDDIPFAIEEILEQTESRSLKRLMPIHVTYSYIAPVEWEVYVGQTGNPDRRIGNPNSYRGNLEVQRMLRDGRAGRRLIIIEHNLENATYVASRMEELKLQAEYREDPLWTPRFKH